MASIELGQCMKKCESFTSIFLHQNHVNFPQDIKKSQISKETF